MSNIKSREWLLSNERIFPLFIRFSLPAITGMMVQALYNIVDRYFIGNMPGVGALAIGGIGITMPILFVLMGFSMLFGIGAGANISIKMGQGNKPMAERILGNAAVMVMITSVLLLIVFSINPDAVLRLFGATADNLGYARDYLSIILVGNLWNALAFAMNNTIRAEGAPKYSMISMLIGAVANTILDPIFIYTLNMGVKGAAYATIIAQFLSFLFGAYFYLSGRSVIKLRRENLRIDPQVLKIIAAIGISPFFIQIAGSVVGALFNNNLKVYGGSMAQGAYTIINTMTMLFFMPMFGMNQGLQPIIGYNYGARNYDRVKRAVVVGVASASVLAVIAWTIMQFFPEILVYPMATDVELRQLTIQGIRRVETFTFIVGLQIIASNFFSSIGKAKVSFFLSLSRQVFILIPMVIILPRFMGLMGVWTAVPVSDFIATVLSAAFLLREFKKLDAQHLAETEQAGDLSRPGLIPSDGNQ